MVDAGDGVKLCYASAGDEVQNRSSEAVLSHEMGGLEHSFGTSHMR